MLGVCSCGLRLCCVLAVSCGLCSVFSHAGERDARMEGERREGEGEHLDNIIEIPAAGALIILLYFEFNFQVVASRGQCASGVRYFPRVCSGTCRGG